MCVQKESYEQGKEVVNKVKEDRVKAYYERDSGRGAPWKESPTL